MATDLEMILKIVKILIVNIEEVILQIQTDITIVTTIIIMEIEQITTDMKVMV